MKKGSMYKSVVHENKEVEIFYDEKWMVPKQIG